MRALRATRMPCFFRNDLVEPHTDHAKVLQRSRSMSISETNSCKHDYSNGTSAGSQLRSCQSSTNESGTQREKVLVPGMKQQVNGHHRNTTECITLRKASCRHDPATQTSTYLKSSPHLSDSSGPCNKDCVAHQPKPRPQTLCAEKCS